MVHRLRGMFAFAIWDDRSGELFLARDPYGIKPLYTADDGWTFRFASQVKALLAGGRVSRDPEPAGLAGFYLFGSVPEPFTLYREIRALPAGHTQIIDAGGPREPQPFASLAAVLAEGARDPGAGRRTRGKGAGRRARQRPGASSRRCRDRRVPLVRHRFGRRAGIAARCRTVENRARSRCNSTNSAARRRRSAARGRDCGALWRRAHRPARRARRVRARPAGYSRRDGSAVDRRGQYLVCREGRERGRSQGRAVGDRRRRTRWPAIRASATCPDGVAGSDRLPQFRGSGGSPGCCCEPWPPASATTIRRRPVCSNIRAAGPTPICCAAACSCRTS